MICAEGLVDSLKYLTKQLYEDYQIAVLLPDLPTKAFMNFNFDAIYVAKPAPILDQVMLDFQYVRDGKPLAREIIMKTCCVVRARASEEACPMPDMQAVFNLCRPVQITVPDSRFEATVNLFKLLRGSDDFQAIYDQQKHTELKEPATKQPPDLQKRALGRKALEYIEHLINTSDRE